MAKSSSRPAPRPTEAAAAEITTFGNAVKYLLDRTDVERVLEQMRDPDEAH